MNISQKIAESQPPVKKIFLVVIILLILTAVSLAKFAKVQPISDQMQNPTSTPYLIENDTPDPTDDRLTYSNDIYQIDYPEDVTMTKIDANTITLTKIGPTQREDTEFYDGILLRLEPIEIPEENFDLRQYVEAEIRNSQQDGIAEIVKDISPMTVNNYQGYTYTMRGLGEYQYIYLQSSNTPQAIIHIINSTVDPEDRGYNQTVNQILDTFEFNI